MFVKIHPMVEQHLKEIYNEFNQESIDIEKVEVDVNKFLIWNFSPFYNADEMREESICLFTKK